MRLVQIFLQETTTRTDDDSSSSALIHAADEEPSKGFGNEEETLQISTDSTAWGGASKMLCCLTSGGGQFQSLGSPKLGSILWQSTNGLKLLGRSLSGALLPPMAPHLQGRLTVVLDLDGTQPVSNGTAPTPTIDGFLLDNYCVRVSDIYGLRIFSPVVDVLQKRLCTPALCQCLARTL